MSNQYDRSEPTFAFVYTERGGIAGVNNTTSYNSITKKLQKNNDIIRELKEAEETKLMQTFRDNGFFTADRFSYPGTGTTDFFEYTIFATMEAKGAFFIWRSDSVGVPQGLEKIRNTIDI